MKCASLTFALVLLASGLVSTPAFAATATASFAVTATVESSCQVSVPGATTGNYTFAGASVRSGVAVACSLPTPYNVSYSSAMATSDATTSSAAELLGHTLPLHNAQAVNWGRMAGNDAMARVGRGTFQPYAVPGKAAGTQMFSPGSYADSITVVITY